MKKWNARREANPEFKPDFDRVPLPAPASEGSTGTRGGTRRRRSDEALAVHDRVDSLYGDRDELPLSEKVAMALNNKGWILGQLGRNDEAIATYDRVESRYGDRDELPLAEQVANRR